MILRGRRDADATNFSALQADAGFGNKRSHGAPVSEYARSNDAIFKHLVESRA